MRIYAEIAGTVCKVEVQAGQAVQEGDTLVIVESMKMEIPICASSSGRVTAVLVGEGDTVSDDTLIVELS